MKYLASLIVLLIGSTLLFGGITLSSEAMIPSSIFIQSQQALTEVMGPRLGVDDELTAHLQMGKERYELVVQLNERSLTIPIPIELGNPASYIADSLVYDGLSLISDLPPFHIQALSSTSVQAPSGSAAVGDRYWALDTQDRRHGLLTTRRVDDEGTLLHQISGKELAIGLGLVKAPKIPLSLGVVIHPQETVGVDLNGAFPTPWYPFSVLVETAYRFGEEFTLGFGLRTELAFSQLFGTKWALGRNLGLSATVSGGGAYHPESGWGVYVRGAFSLEYTIGGWRIFAGGGENALVFEDKSFHYGLFFHLGTAYTFI